MAETAPKRGSALRVYQLVGVLAIGWIAGRLPAMLADNRMEESRLMDSLQPASHSGTAGAGPMDGRPDADVETARMAGEVAAQVAAQIASQVANETVARLIAAGWGPAPHGRSVQLQPIIIQQPGQKPVETLVRIEQVAQLPSPATPALPTETGPTAIAQAAPPADGQSGEAHQRATEGYAAIKAGDPREGVRLLSEALLIDPAAPQANIWSGEVRRLTRRWSIAGYTLARQGSVGDPLAASPVLGGGQTGAAVAYTLDPLARRPISVVARVTAAAQPNGGLDRETGELAIGVRARPFPRLPIAVDVERRIALGAASRNAWAARLSGGATTTVMALDRPVSLEAYGEAGLVGFSRPDYYGGVQGRASTPLATLGRARIDVGAGAWGAAQESGETSATRFDIGPSARVQLAPWPFSAQFDYRFRLAGNALPGSGPVLTVAGQF